MLPGSFHIIVIPRNAANTKRFCLSAFTIRLLALGGMLALPLVIGSFFLVFHFQNELVSVKRKTLENRQILEEKEIISMRLSGLERSLSHAEQSLGSLEQTMDVELNEMKEGLGPIPDDVWLSGENKELPPKSSVDMLLENGEQLTLFNLKGNISTLSDRVESLNDKIKEIYELNGDKIRFVHSNPTRVPVEGWITSDFGMRRSPYSGVTKMHYGVDIASPVGTPVQSAADGKVVFADFRGGYGRMIVIDHGYGLSTIYGHTSQLFVKKGDVIKRGDIIASVGSTGASTGPHLHYEVHVDGIPADPLNFLVQ